MMPGMARMCGSLDSKIGTPASALSPSPDYHTLASMVGVLAGLSVVEFA